MKIHKLTPPLLPPDDMATGEEMPPPPPPDDTAAGVGGNVEEENEAEEQDHPATFKRGVKSKASRERNQEGIHTSARVLETTQQKLRTRVIRWMMMRN